MTGFSESQLKVPEIDFLHSTLCAYFHQDWDLESPTPDGVVQNILDDLSGSEEELEKFSKGISSVLKAIEDHPDIKALLQGYGQNYDPSYDGLTMIEWLVGLQERVKNFSSGA